MLDRLSSYFLIISATIFTAVQGFAIVKHVRLHTGRPTPDYIRAIGIMIAIMVIVVSIRSLTRSKASSITKRSISLSHAPGSFAKALHQVSAVSTRHPALTPVLILSLLTIPLGLGALTKPHGWKDFGARDWIGIGVAGMPLVILAVFSMIVGWTSRAKNLQSKRQSDE